MQASVQDGGEMSEAFTVSTGTKQWCVLAPTLFSLFFSAMLYVAFKGLNLGIPIEYRTDAGVFNLGRFRAKTKTKKATIRELLFADDCALVTHNSEDLQLLVDKFATSCRRFGLTISVKKIEVIRQALTGAVDAQSIFVEGQQL